MKSVAIAGGALVLIVIVVGVVGWMQPVKHRVTRQATYRVAAAPLYDLITGVDAFPSWRSKLTSIEHETPTRFREVGGNGRILFEITEQVPGQRVVTRIADPSLPFGGSWTYELLPASDGRTTLRITEDGEVYNPVFRFVSRFVMGHSATIDQYLRDVGQYLKEEPVIT